MADSSYTSTNHDGIKCTNANLCERKSIVKKDSKFKYTPFYK